MGVLSIVLVLTVTIPVHAVAGLTVSLPSFVAKPILRVGQTFQMNVSMSNSPGVSAWQVNITFSPSMLHVSGISWGPDWSPPRAGDVVRVNNAGGSLLAGSFFVGLSTQPIQGSDVLFTITWTVMDNKAGTSLHIVTLAENRWLGTVFLTPDASILPPIVVLVPYSTVDGSFCNWNTRKTCS